MKIRKDGWDRYAEIKVTTTTYCQSCSKDFEDPEIVFYAPIDNTIICKECIKVHSTKEPRVFIGGAYR